MRIVYFTDAYWPRINGVTVSVQTFADALKRRGHEVLIVCPEYPKAAGITPEIEYGIIRIPSVRSFFSAEDRVSNPLAIQAVGRELDAFEPDIIHVQTEFSFGAMGRLYAKARGYPVISTCHTHWEQYFEHYMAGTPSRFSRAIARTIMRTAYRSDNVIILPSAQIGEVLKRYGIKKEFYIIPTGIDARTFSPDSARDDRVRRYLVDRFPSLSSGPILLFVGRVGQEKNIGFLFDVLTGVRHRHPQASLLIVGDGPYRQALMKQAEAAGLGAWCCFTGYLPREDLPSVYAIADVFTFPSKTETQGLVTIESMLCGTPVVAIGEMGTADVMGGDNGGFMVQDDPALFTDRVLRLIEDSKLREEKSAEAIEYAQRWTVEGMTDKLLAVYEAVAARRRQRRRGPLNAVRRKLWEVRRYFR